MGSKLGSPLLVDLGSVVLFCIRVQLLSKYGQRIEPKGMKCPSFRNNVSGGKAQKYCRGLPAKSNFQQYATVSLSTTAAACRKLGADRKRTRQIAKKQLGEETEEVFFPKQHPEEQHASHLLAVLVRPTKRLNDKALATV